MTLSQSMTTRDGRPRFRTEPEFESKLCTRCDEYWPCDTEFFRRNHGCWCALCRACEAELVRRSRAKSLARRAVNAVAVAGLLITSVAVSASEFCNSVEAITVAMQRDKEAGFTRYDMTAALAGSRDDELRAVGDAVIRLVYTGNADNGLSARSLGRLAKSACLSTEVNAMSPAVSP